MNVLIVVDMQNDFIDGVLGNESAVKIVENAKKKIFSFDGEIFYTQDTHTEKYMDTLEGKHLPVPHCIAGTKGHNIREELYKEGCEIIKKQSFGSPVLIAKLQEISQREKIETITMIGICTDICVMVNTMTIKTFFPEIPITVDSSCCSGVTDELHSTALDVMRSCQIDII